MTKTQSFLSKVLKPEDNLFILAGAGISKTSPSNLPTGIDFTNSFYNFLLKKANDIEFKKNIEFFKSHNSLRLENIMSILNKDYTGSIQLLLDCYRECTYYNKNHIMLKELGMYGHIISTTNFDSLIERAYLNDDILLSPIIYENEFGKKHQAGNIYKLHGSIGKYNHIDKDWIDSTDSIQITLEQIGKQGYEFALSLPKRQFLIENIRNKHMIVIGYSGCDDFDIIPIILNTKSDRKIIWLEYSPGLDVVVNGREIVKSTDKFGRVGFIFSELIRRGQREIENCYIVKTDANIFLKSIINVFNNSYEDPEIAQFEYQINSDTYFLNKFKKIFPNLNHILKMKAILYFIIEDYTNSLKNYSKILSNIEKEKNLKFKSSVFHEVAYCYINLAIPDYDNAIKYSMKSFEIDVENKFVSILLSADQFASLLFKVGKIKDSLDVYKSIISSKLDLNSYFLKYQFATLLNNYAIHLNQLGKMDDSIKTAEKSAELFKNIGDLNGLVNSTLTITTPLMELGYIDKAMVKLRDLEKIIKDLGSLFSLCVLYNELGITYRLKKEFDESIKYHKEAIKFAEIGNLKTELARNFYNIALCQLQKGNFDLSKEFNSKSLEIREQLTDSTEKYRDLSENMQLVGNILFEKAKVEANPSRSINKLKNARIAFEKSNSFAESTQYLKAVCDNYSNLLSIAIMLAEDSEVDRLYNILKMLLTDKMNIPERLERIELIVRMYREARQLYRNNI